MRSLPQSRSPFLVTLAFVLTSGLSSLLIAQSSPDLRKDAERGDAAAQYRLGLAYRDGAGGEKDLVEAYRWVSLAASRATADQAATFSATRDLLIGSMTLAQVAEGQKRARAWLDAFAPDRSATPRAVMTGTPAPSTEAPTRIGTDIPAPSQIKHVDPVYPTIAQRAKVQGSVMLDVTISPAGRVTSIEIVRSIPLLDQAAVDAVRQWEFAPTTRNGVAVPVIMTVTVRFELR
jgi:protein TonB